MPTILTHAVVAGGLAYDPRATNRRLLVTAALLSILPDADVIGFSFGISYSQHFGHRGATHSVAFAVLAAGIATALLRKQGRPLTTFFVLFASALSHPLLDMLTNGGLGCAIWAPFSWWRHFFPWRPIPVAPIGIKPGLGRVIGREALLVWPWPVAACLIRWGWARRRHG